MFKFKGISSEDMQVVIEEEEHFIARAAQRYEMIEIEGRDGAEFNELGYSVVERPIYVQCLNINKIDDILAWLDGEGEFEYKGRKTTARFYSELEPKRSSCIRIIDTTFIRDPFWYKANEEYLLVKDRKDKIASGESIDLSDSAEMRCELNIRGNSVQKTSTQGKNMFNLREANYTGLGVNVIKNGSTLTLNGTMNTSGNLLNTVGDIYNFIYLGKFKPGTYRFSKFIISGKYSKNGSIGAGSFACYIRKKDKELLGEILGSASNREGVTITLKEDTDLYVQIFCNAGAIFENYVLGFQLEEGSVTTNLEEFKPNMPSPDYPSENESCGDNINIFDGEFESGCLNSANGANETNTSRIRSVNYIEVLPNRTYTFCLYGFTRLIEYDENKQFVNYQGNKFSFTTSETTKYIRFSIMSTDVNLKEKLVEGTFVGEYSPYGQGCINEVICNKNICDVTTLQVSQVEEPIKINVKEENIYNLSFIKSRITGATISSDKIYDIRTIRFFDENNNLLSQLTGTLYSMPSGSSISIKKQIETPKNTKYILIYLGNNNGDNNVNTLVSKIQLEEGPATPYEEHKSQAYTIPTQQPFRSNGDIRDTFIKKDGKRYEHHPINRYYFTGNENISIPSSPNEYGIYNANCVAVSCINFIGKSNYYKNQTNFIAQTTEEGVFIYNNAIYIRTKKTNANDLKTYLSEQYNAGTPVYVDYVLSKPLDIECTEEQNKILDKIEKEAKTYDKVTHMYSTDKISSYKEVRYFTSTDEKINNEGNIQSRPILRLEKTVSEAVELTINDVRFKYNFKGDSYVEIDCKEKTVEYEELNRNRQIIIGYKYPKLNIGNNNIIMNEGDCIIKILRKDRWR